MDISQREPFSSDSCMEILQSDHQSPQPLQEQLQLRLNLCDEQPPKKLIDLHEPCKRHLLPNEWQNHQQVRDEDDEDMNESNGDEDAENDEDDESGEENDDSDDEEIEYHWITEEEDALYTRVVEQSGGFDVPLLPGALVSSAYIIPVILVEERGELELLAREAIQMHNEQNHKNFEFMDISKANKTVGRYRNYYITFRAKDVDNGQTKIFQAFVKCCYIGERYSKVEFCKEKVVEGNSDAEKLCTAV